MASSSLQDMYVSLLLERVRQERFPSPEHLDRIEAAVRRPEQLREYLDLLFERVAMTRYPSAAMLDRIQRLAALQQNAGTQA